MSVNTIFFKVPLALSSTFPCGLTIGFLTIFVEDVWFQLHVAKIASPSFMA